MAFFSGLTIIEHYIEHYTQAAKYFAPAEFPESRILLCFADFHNCASAASESDLKAFLAQNNGSVGANTLLDLQLGPALKPVTAARHF